MDNSQPHTYPQRTLLLVSGMSPQIVTETLYALTQSTKPAFVPTAIHLITTTDGAEQARLNLLDGPGHYHRFCQTYNLDTAPFSRANIHVIHDANGNALDDIRTPEQNRATADFITDQMRHLTSDPETALHVSMAGGRKTMGYYIGYALSLFGRPQDRLSHVLVSAGYEGLPNFYYPTPAPHTIHDRDNMALDASHAQISLAEIPFVRLRSGQPERILNGNASFNEAVEYANRANQPPHLTLHPKQCTYTFNGIDGKLSPIQMALLLWLAVRRQQGTEPVESIFEGENRSTDLHELQATADKHWVILHKRTVDKLDDEGLIQGWLQENISKINRTLIDTLGQALAARCQPKSRRVNGKRGYALPPDLTIDID